MSNKHSGNVQPQLDLEEHSRISGVDGKKVFVIDDSGNQIISFSSPTISFVPTSYYQNASLASGYVFHGFAVPGSNPTTTTFKLQREVIDTGEVLFGAGSGEFTHQWSVASMPSISWS